MPQVTPTETDLLARAIESRIGDIDVAMPGQIVSYDAAKRTCSVQPMIKRVKYTDDDEPVYEALPVLPNVPVIFPSAASFSLHYTLAAGDSVQLIINTRALAEWRQSDKNSEPGDVRLHHINFATAIPGLWPNVDASSTASDIAEDTGVSIGKPGSTTSRIHFESTAVEIGDSAQPVAMAAAVQQIITSLTALATAMTGAGAAPVTGTALGSAINAALATIVIPLASSNLKAKPSI